MKVERWFLVLMAVAAALAGFACLSVGALVVGCFCLMVAVLCLLAMGGAS